MPLCVCNDVASTLASNERVWRVRPKRVSRYEFDYIHLEEMKATWKKKARCAKVNITHFTLKFITDELITLLAYCSSITKHSVTVFYHLRYHHYLSTGKLSIFLCWEWVSPSLHFHWFSKQDAPVCGGQLSVWIRNNSLPYTQISV
jgi:hypothetical protein